MSRGVQPYGQKPAEQSSTTTPTQQGDPAKRGKKTSARDRNTGIEPRQDGRTDSKGKAYEILSDESGDARKAEMSAKHAEDKGQREKAHQDRIQADAEQDAKACSDTSSVMGGVGAAVGVVAAIGVAASAAPPFGWIVSLICAVIVVATIAVNAVGAAKKGDAAGAAAKGAQATEAATTKTQKLHEEYTEEGGVAEQIADRKAAKEAAASAATEGNESDLTTTTEPKDTSPAGEAALDSAATQPPVEAPVVITPEGS
jgi:hypothetical protein